MKEGEKTKKRISMDDAFHLTKEFMKREMIIKFNNLHVLREFSVCETGCAVRREGVKQKDANK